MNNTQPNNKVISVMRHSTCNRLIIIYAVGGVYSRYVSARDLESNTYTRTEDV